MCNYTLLCLNWLKGLYETGLKARVDKNPRVIHVSEEILFGLTSASAAEQFLHFIFLQKKHL